MRDFGYEDERDLEGFFEGEDTNDLMGMAQLDLIGANLNQQLLQMAIVTAEKEWFWKFRSSEYKIKKIAMIFRHLNKLLEELRE